MAEQEDFLKHEDREGTLVITVENTQTLDENRAFDMHEKIEELVAGRSGIKVVLNLANVKVVCTAAWGKMMLIHNRLRKKDGKFKLCHLQPHIYEVLRVMKLDQLFSLYETEEAACADVDESE